MNPGTKNGLFLLFLTLAFGLTSAETVKDSLFPTPDILKANVAFWKKVYSELSLRDGVLHDREYPLVIYQKFTGEINIPLIRSRKEHFIALIKNINTQPESSWGSDEKAVVELFKQNASVEALKGADERIRFQQGQADRFKEGLIRSGMYLDTIRSILREHGVPERLAYLPHVESSFNTAAYSKVGAAGLWQFMRGTGKLFGMKIDYSIDERRDPIIATVGAAKYLSGAYRELKAWPLAITSYNHGVNGMKRAVSSTGSRDLGYIIQNYESKSFKFASSNFYSCFLAASEIAMDYKTYFPDVALHPRMHFTDLTLDNYIAPHVLCKYLGISTDQFTELNPAIRLAVFEQHKKLPKGFVVHIPSSITSTIASSALSKIPDSLKSKVADRPQYYKVNKGDNLFSIASRLGVTVQELALENNISRKSRIYSGQLLRVPAIRVAEKSVETVVAAATPIADTSKAVQPEAKEVAAITTPNSEALLEIAQAEIQSHLPPEEKAQNKDVVEIPVPINTKQVVKKSSESQVPVELNSKQATAPKQIDLIADSLKDVAAAPAIEEKEQKPQARQFTSGNFDVSIYNLEVLVSPMGTTADITVSLDETIGHYADWLGIATSRIRKLNGMGRGSDIRVNGNVTLPIDNKDNVDKFVAARLEYHMAIEEDFYSQYKVLDSKSKIIKKGETLWDICNGGDQENAVPQWLFKKYNKHLDLNRLSPGTTVWIPMISGKSDEEILLDETQSPGFYAPFIQRIRVDSKGAIRVP